MKTMFQSIACVLAFAAMSSAPLHAQKKAAPTKDIVDTAVAAGSFKTLAAALTAAGLVDTLKSEGPFTVFAPTDEAFAKLPAGTVENLLKPENKAKLAEILTYHVVAGEIPLFKVLAAGEGTSLQGSKVNIRFEDGKVKIGDSALVNADIKTRNGVIHVIDTVLIPPPTKKRAPAPQNSKHISDLTVDELTDLLNAINIQIQSAPEKETRPATQAPAFSLSIQRITPDEEDAPAVNREINFAADDIKKLIELRDLLNAAKERE